MGSFPRTPMRAKPLFRWTHASHTVRERMDLAVSIQAFFYMIVDAGLNAEAVSRNYPLQIEGLKTAMREIGVTVDEPAWFNSLLR